MITTARSTILEWFVRLCLSVALTTGLSPLAYAQNASEDDADDLGEGEGEASAETAPGVSSEEADATGESDDEQPSAAKPPPAPAAPPPPASPFVFTITGLVSGSMYMQNLPAVSNGGTLSFATSKPVADGWFLGGDVRQTRFRFTIRGPQVFGGATPLGIAEMDLGGYNYQILASPGLQAVVSGPSAMGPTTYPLGYNTVTNEPRFDENLVPHIRLAYIELNWNNSQNILRVGQYHNLLLGMIAGSASHISLPLGYGAGQLGWRSPGLTYLHRFALSADTNLDVGLQVNRNSWRDELPTCSSAAMQVAPASNCLPNGISVGEASMLPQVQARIMVFGGLAQDPLPFYLPVKWLAYLAADWDRKDLTGVGNATLPASAGVPYRDSMDTFVTQAGFKFQLGPVLVAANGWYGKNAGNVFGHIFQMQDLNGSDVTGFGAWGQVALGITKNLSLWGFGGIDQPDENQVRKAGRTLQVAGATLLRNMQFVGQLAYQDGPVLVAAELMYVITTELVPPEASGTATTRSAIQPSITMNYNF